MTTIAMASDHGGLELKAILARHLAGLGHEVQDLGPEEAASCDYPVFARKLCDHLLAGGAERGILICGTGLGMSMAANRVRGIRAALCANEFSARMARAHNDANVLCLGQRVLGDQLALSITEAFLEAAFEGGRHARRIDLFESM